MASAISAVSGNAASLYEGLKPVDVPIKYLDREQTAAATNTTNATSNDAELRKAFNEFVGGTFMKTMLKSLRETTGKVPYLDGGYAEQVFRSQLDEELAGRLAESHGSSFSNALYDHYRQGLPGQSRSEAAAGETGNVLNMVG